MVKPILNDFLTWEALNPLAACFEASRRQSLLWRLSKWKKAKPKAAATELVHS
ncbi:hypothetical protein PbB2_00803 [Candidatus Phycosocius bacilliformis]|uniref:Uncharacterized protein n=1 Tax=Candidatus Phycosocius bacilliformis TaxID=1445552 RepID=A0A2P2E7V5_9PROT|nr:hypothetical protein PbB2_00803 [Candidatus Phycosocius bacilliformis]